MLFVAVLGVMAVFMALLLVCTGWAERKEDSYLPTEARWRDGPDRLKKPPKPVPRELRDLQLQPGRSPPRAPRAPTAPVGGTQPLRPIAPGSRRPPPPPMYPADPGRAGRTDRDPAGYPPQPPGGAGFAQPAPVQPQGYGQARRVSFAPHQAQLRRLPSQNQHGW